MPQPFLFLTPLSLGGKLTLVNANFWVIFVLLARAHFLARNAPTLNGVLCEFLIPVMGFPLLWLIPNITGATGIWAMLPTAGLPGVWGMLFAAVILGVNAFLWGYGLAWIIARARILFSSRH